MPAVAAKLPTAQVAQGVQLEAFVTLEKLPVAQGAQTRSMADDGVFDTNWPHGQTVHAVQAAVPPADHVDEPHGLQLTSLLAVPATKPWPAGQEVRDQFVQAIVPPADQVPALHVTQVAPPCPSST